MSDGLSGVKYTPASPEEDPEDCCPSDAVSLKMAYMTSSHGGGTIPFSGDTLRQGTTLPTPAAAKTTCPSSQAVLNVTHPYYDFQDSDDNDSDCEGGGGAGGCDSGDPSASSPGLLPNGNPSLNNHSAQYYPGSRQAYPTHQHHTPLSEKTSMDSSSGRQPQHSSEIRDTMELRGFSKSPLSRGSQAGSKGHCMCCMMCIFLLSTAGLGAVLALACAGKVELRSPDPKPSVVSHSNGGFKIDRLGDEKVTSQVS